MFRHIRIVICAGVLVAGAVAAMPAFAETSVAAGYFVPTPDRKAFGLMATTGFSLPVVPVAPQVTLAVPFSGSRYALTGEARIGYPRAYVGAGIGVARLNSTGNAGSVYDLFVGHRILPLTTIEARYYGSGGNRTGSSGFIGLRIVL